MAEAAETIAAHAAERAAERAAARAGLAAPEASADAAAQARARENIAARLAAFAHDLRFDDIPAAVRERAKHHILDALGIALASTRFDFAHRTLSALQGLSGPGAVALFGLPARLPPRDAALMNGTLCHGLDFDDTHLGGVIHPTASAFPAALSAAVQAGDAAGRDGRDLLTAYVIGVETAARLGAVAKGGFHQVGFHPTGLIGTFSSALVAGRLLGLTPQALHMAQGIALSQASGSLEFLEDGAWTKRLHPGLAASNGLTAAALAAQGFVGAADPYGGRFGLYRAYLGPSAAACDLGLATAGLGETWELCNTAIKPYPACHFTHGCIDAALALVSEHEIRPEDIAEIRAFVPAEVVKTVCEPVENKMRPANSYDAQFSIPWLVAAAIRSGRMSLAEVAPEALNDPATLALARKVRYEIDPDSGFPQHYSGEVAIVTRDGREWRHREAINRGAAERPLSNGEIVAKFFANATTAVARQRAEALAETVLALDRLDIATLNARLGG